MITGGAWWKGPVDQFTAPWVSAPLLDFLQTPVDDIRQALSFKAGEQSMGPTPEQLQAWDDTIHIVGRALAKVLRERPAARDWSVLFEYVIPRRLGRPDVVILLNGVVVVIEMKVGASTFLRADEMQALDYARDLEDFHEASRDLPVVPALCATAAMASATTLGGDGWRQPQRLVTDDLANFLMDADASLGDGQPIDLVKWDTSRYHPTPSILQTARDLYAGQSVREISHAHADNLDTTVDEIKAIINEARTQKKRTLCFVTGVPGSGKTLTGLSAVHEHDAEADTATIGTYLSGNGPLVDVLRYALARDQQMRSGTPFKEALNDSSVFIQGVHGFIGELGASAKTPPENVIVFDEAQRAWDAQRMLQKQGIGVSEAALALGIMERAEGWAVVVALVGEGQEINSGEAGIASWTAAARDRPGWDVVVSPHVAHDLVGPRVSQKLHLTVGVRAPRAQQLSDWAEHVVAGWPEAAAKVCPDPDEYPILLTRSLTDMRSYLRDRSSEDRRSGLLASAQARRLRAFGIEMNGSFQSAINWPRWFVDPIDDVQSSYALEVAASEFKCQGLEIDWAGLCWGSDFTWDGSAGTWVARRMSGSRWNKDSDQTHAINRYRVLLTRARYGMVIWVPQVTAPTLLVDGEALDSTAGYLEACGATILA